jgi:hypothetical protein
MFLAEFHQPNHINEFRREVSTAVQYSRPEEYFNTCSIRIISETFVRKTVFSRSGPFLVRWHVLFL